MFTTQQFWTFNYAKHGLPLELYSAHFIPSAEVLTHKGDGFFCQRKDHGFGRRAYAAALSSQTFVHTWSINCHWLFNFTSV
eukprot:jgi/Botrbrau1/14897/Bobra.0018s0002.1